MRNLNPFSTPRRSLLLALASAVGFSLLTAGTASADLLTPESGPTPNANTIDDLYKVVLVIATIIFVVVVGALFYSLWKYRARKGAVAAQIHGNTRLEIAWTAGAAAILVVISVVTFAMLGDIRNPPNSDEDGFQVASVTAPADGKRLPPDGKSLNIKVNGQQYVWRYTYDDGDGNVLNDVFSYEEMVVPTKTTVTLDIQSQDVAHSWWIPKLGGKFDAVPGYTNYTWFKIDEPGVFTGQCAEMCGRNHTDMTARVRAVPPAEFERWLAQQRKDIDAANLAARTQREEIEGALNADPVGAGDEPDLASGDQDPPSPGGTPAAPESGAQDGAAAPSTTP